MELNMNISVDLMTGSVSGKLSQMTEYMWK